MCKTFKNGATKARQLYQNALAIDATCNDAVDGELAQACLPACFFASRIGSVLGAAARIYRSIYLFWFGSWRAAPRLVGAGCVVRHARLGGLGAVPRFMSGPSVLRRRHAARAEHAPTPHLPAVCTRAGLVELDFEEGKFEAAIKMLEAHLEHSRPDSAYTRLADVHFAAGNNPQALVRRGCGGRSLFRTSLTRHSSNIFVASVLTIPIPSSICPPTHHALTTPSPHPHHALF